MRIYQDGEQTIIDGEGLQTFIKPGQTAGARIENTPITVIGGAVAMSQTVSKHTLTNFAFEQLTGNPLKDILRLVRWYFS